MKRRLPAAIFLVLLSYSVQGLSQEIWRNPPVQLPQNVAEWLHFEVKANPGSDKNRTTDPIHLEHVDIPARLLSEDIGIGLRPEVYSSLVYEKDGEKFIRWIFNPEDTKYRDKIIHFVRAYAQVEPVIERKFVGYLTASRSVIVQNPDNGAIFSLKTSTNKTGGIWQDKKMTEFAAQVSRALSDFIASHAPSDHLKSFVALTEPYAAIAKEIDASFTVRDYPAFTDRKIRMLPFFTALDEEYGQQLALEMGSEDPTTCWKEHLFEPWGLAMAEEAAYYGLSPNSAHSQDYIIERDENGKPTKRIYARDLMDSDVDEMILQARHGTRVLEIFKRAKELQIWKGKVLMRPIPFYVIRWPKWITDNRFIEMMRGGFHEKFISRYKQITGVQDFTSSPYSYELERYFTHEPNFLNWLKKIRSRDPVTLSCEKVFIEN